MLWSSTQSSLQREEAACGSGDGATHPNASPFSRREEDRTRRATLDLRADETHRRPSYNGSRERALIPHIDWPVLCAYRNSCLIRR